jgi:DNA-binding NarL/FixJ family response regulator
MPPFFYERPPRPSSRLSKSLFRLGDVAQLQGDDARAEPLYEQCLVVARELGDRIFIAAPHRCLGYLAQRRGEPARATALFKEALAMFHELGVQVAVAGSLIALAGIAAARGDHPESLRCAARVLGAAEALLETTGAHRLQPLDRLHSEHSAALVRAAVPKDVLATEWAAGQAMPLDAVIAAAMGIEAPAEPGAPMGPSAATHLGKGQPSAYPAGLTEREVEVLRLVARGLTSAQVAEELVISSVTVSTHLRNIYGKIGVNSRAAATRWAVEQGLA